MSVIWQSAEKFRSRRRPVNRDLHGSKQLVPDFATGGVTSDEISKYAQRTEHEAVAQVHQIRSQQALSRLYGQRRSGRRPHTSDSKSAFKQVADLDNGKAQHFAFNASNLTPSKHSKARVSPSRPRSVPGDTHCDGPRPGSPAFFARKPRTIRHSGRLTSRINNFADTNSGKGRSSKSSVASTRVADKTPAKSSTPSEPGEIARDLVQTILGNDRATHLASSNLSPGIACRPSSRVAGPSTLHPGRRFSVATPASVQPVPLPHVAARLETGAFHEESVEDVQTFVRGSYSDLIEPSSSLAAPPANFSPFTVLERLSRPQSRTSSPNAAPIAAHELLEKGKRLFQDQQHATPGTKHTQAEEIQLVSNASFWDELDRFVEHSAPRKQNDDMSSHCKDTQEMIHSPVRQVHITNVGSHRSGTAARSLIKPVAASKLETKPNAPPRQISQTFIGVGVELPTEDPLAMRAVQSAQQKLEAAFKARPGQHSAGEFFVVGPRGSSACTPLPSGESLRKDGLLFNKLPTEKGPIQAPLRRGQSPPHAQGSFHSPLNTLSLRQREAATQFVMQNTAQATSNFTQTLASTFRSMASAQQPPRQDQSKHGDNTDELTLLSTSATISPRRRSSSDVGMRTGVGSTRGGTSVASPASRLQTYGRRNSSAALRALAPQEDDDVSGWAHGKTRAEASDGYENAASNGFYAGLRRAGSSIADEAGAVQRTL